MISVLNAAKDVCKKGIMVKAQCGQVRKESVFVNFMRMSHMDNRKLKNTKIYAAKTNNSQNQYCERRKFYIDNSCINFTNLLQHLIRLQLKAFWQFLHRATAAAQGDNHQSLRQSVQCFDFQRPTTDSLCLVSIAHRGSL